MTRPQRPDWYWEIAVATNAVVKGALGAAGQSGHACARAVPVSCELDCAQGLPSVLDSVADALKGRLRDGDTVVIADKVIAAALGRIAGRRIISDPDPKTIDPAKLDALAQRRSRELGFMVTSTHLLLADEYLDDLATCGTDDPNVRAHEAASVIAERTGSRVDVVISDTDTGVDTRSFLIGTLTLGATPLGATAGVNLYEAMRCAVAAEFVRGHTRRIPVVVCQPAERRRGRVQIGLARPYRGFLDANQEEALTHA